MTDKDKVMVLVGFIKGVIGNDTYISSLYVDSVKKILKEIRWDA